MPSIGRNDPCPCGSGKKYKRCCLNQPQSSPVQVLNRQIREELSWSRPPYKEVADQLSSAMSPEYDPAEIESAVGLWNMFAEETRPDLRKPGVYAAAVEYVIASGTFKKNVTQAFLAKKYGVSEAMISRRFHEIMDAMETTVLEETTPAHTRSLPPNPFLTTERMMRQLGTAMSEHGGVDSGIGGKIRPKREQAQELLFKAMEHPSSITRIRLAKKALKLYPDSPDAYCLLAENLAGTPEEAAQYYFSGMQAGERELGPSFFEENQGYFWGRVETRPYMRAKQGYAECLWNMGRAEEAIEQFRHLLTLNPDDNQGIRYLLLSCWLELEDYGRAEDLIERYEDDAFAHFAYNRILIEYGKNGITGELDRHYREAKERNPHIVAYLLGREPLPAERPLYMGLGDEQEAIAYCQEHLNLWKRKPKLLQWLQSKAN